MTTFDVWLDDVLGREVPPATKAWHFYLYECETAVEIQVVGVDSFTPPRDPEATFYPATTVFSTGDEVFSIDFEAAGDGWEAWFATCLGQVRAYLARGKRAAVLKASLGVSIGFVDGDAMVVWSAERP